MKNLTPLCDALINLAFAFNEPIANWNTLSRYLQQGGARSVAPPGLQAMSVAPDISNLILAKLSTGPATRSAAAVKEIRAAKPDEPALGEKNFGEQLDAIIEQLIETGRLVNPANGLEFIVKKIEVTRSVFYWACAIELVGPGVDGARTLGYRRIRRSDAEIADMVEKSRGRAEFVGRFSGLMTLCDWLR